MCFGVFVQVNEHSKHRFSKPIGYVIQENGCCDWVGYRHKRGYGKIGIDGTTKCGEAHRVLYEKWRGPIPVGLYLDHLCRNRACVNPDHLEIVTFKENVLRGIGPTAQNARKTHCKRGHVFAGKNLRLTGKTNQHRRCMECRRMREGNLHYKANYKKGSATSKWNRDSHIELSVNKPESGA